MNPDEQFFYNYAGYSDDPMTETPEQGRMRCAHTLALMEACGRDAGLYCDWTVDNDCEPASEHAEMWQCICYDTHGRVVASLGGIDFGEDGLYRSTYRRVVEAELAQEVLS